VVLLIGLGVPPDQLPHIFERFYRAAGAGVRPRSPGSVSGLGLAIAAEIASAHGGTAHAAPTAPRGLRITLIVPAGERPDPLSARELAAAAT
jgi:signal transduction histidine kinase